MEVVISGSNMEEMRVDLTISGATPNGTVMGIPAGDQRQFTVNGYDASGAVAYTGSATLDLPAGEVVPVHVVVRSTTGGSGNGTGTEPSQEEAITVDLPGGARMEMVWIEPGTFVMGSPSTEPGRYFNEGPVHDVTISQGFYLGKYEVTQGEWESVMGSNPSSYTGTNRPVEKVSWNDIEGFIEKLNTAAGKNMYRLPTEAEWEYACRAGMSTRWSFGDDESRLGEYAWYSGNNSPFGTKEVGTKKPNTWRLYDMHGNVYEWCQDWYLSYSSSAQTDPAGSATGSLRVLRGGHFYGYARDTRSALRLNFSPSYRGRDVGFRLLRTP